MLLKISSPTKREFDLGVILCITEGRGGWVEVPRKTTLHSTMMNGMSMVNFYRERASEEGSGFDGATRQVQYKGLMWKKTQN